MTPATDSVGVCSRKTVAGEATWKYSPTRNTTLNPKLCSAGLGVSVYPLTATELTRNQNFNQSMASSYTQVTRRRRRLRRRYSPLAHIQCSTPELEAFPTDCIKALAPTRSVAQPRGAGQGLVLEGCCGRSVFSILSLFQELSRWWRNNYSNKGP